MSEKTTYTEEELQQQIQQRLAEVEQSHKFEIMELKSKAYDSETKFKDALDTQAKSFKASQELIISIADSVGVQPENGSIQYQPVFDRVKALVDAEQELLAIKEAAGKGKTKPSRARSTKK